MSTMDDLANAAAESKEHLVTNLRRVIADAEELLTATADDGSSKLADLRERVKDNLRVARDKLADADAIVRARARRAAEMTDDYVHDNPWSSIGAAAALGLLVGVLIGSRR
ncbi:MAG: DUF883 family protein [Burkholderiaceae bacterium]|jgi:ElaB/YqjD/DUF883 family membrane-anchored ribosome-binding protein|nr:DUF883 family protein [Burkholderiaceae bacterium]